MTDHISIEEYKKRKSETKKTKHHNQKIVVDGVTYDSKLEAKHATEYKILVDQKELPAVIPQVSIPVVVKRHGSNGVRMRVDFLVIHEVYQNGEFRAEFVDSKGIETREWKNKAEALKSMYGIDVRRRTK